MKKTALFLFLLIVSLPLQAQIKLPQFNTGDLNFDVSLEKINAEAKKNITNFIKNATKAFQVTESKIQAMLKEQKMEPADIYMALTLSQQLNHDLDDVIKQYQIDKKKGWGVIAKNLGIKPGSPEFHRLKRETKRHSEQDKKKQRRDDDDDEERHHHDKKKKRHGDRDDDD